MLKVATPWQKRMWPSCALKQRKARRRWRSGSGLKSLKRSSSKLFSDIQIFRTFFMVLGQFCRVQQNILMIHVKTCISLAASLRTIHLEHWEWARCWKCKNSFILIQSSAASVCLFWNCWSGTQLCCRKGKQNFSSTRFLQFSTQTTAEVLTSR